MTLPAPRWWHPLANRRILFCVAAGFSSGLPLYVTLQLVPAWLQSEGLDMASIGLFASTGLPYTWKFAWAPLLDRYAPPLFGRRRGWALALQILLLVAIAGFALLNPATSLAGVAALCVAVSFFSASQDIVLDAWRREALADAELGFGNAMFVNAYRVSSLIPGGLSLILADHASWPVVHLFTAAFMGVGVVASLLAPEPEIDAPPPPTLRAAVLDPFREFFSRSDLRAAVLLLLFMLLYKLGDTMATALITPFYLDIGFTKTQVGSIAKVVGLWSSIVGGTVGGALMARIGIHRALWVFGLIQAAAILAFAGLAVTGPVPAALAGAVCAEYLGVGLGTAAFVAFLSRNTNKRFTATQYALFSSFIALPRTLAASAAGWLSDAVGWPTYFLACALLALPGLALLPWVAPWGDDPSE